MSTHLDDIAYRAQQQPAARFTALAHHLTEDFLEETWQALNAHGAPGLLGKPWQPMRACGDFASPNWSSG